LSQELSEHVLGVFVKYKPSPLVVKNLLREAIPEKLVAIGGDAV